MPRPPQTHVTGGSSSIKGYQYDPSTEEMTVTFRNGGIYKYKGVPRASYNAMKRNKSAGKTLHKWVKSPGLDYEKIASALTQNYQESWEDLFPGGAADDKQPWDFDLGELDKGMKVELKATSNRHEAMERAMDNLAGNPRHYSEMKKESSEDPRKKFFNMLRDRVREETEIDERVRSATKRKGAKAAKKKLPPVKISGKLLAKVAAFRMPIAANVRTMIRSKTKKIIDKDDAKTFRRFIDSAPNETARKIALMRARSLLAGHPSIAGKRAGNVLAPMSGEFLAKSASPVKCQRSFDGLKLKLEQEPGDIRSGKSADGKEWSRKMRASYGYIAGSGGKGADGEALDIYLSKEPTQGAKVYRVHQKRRSGEFDEHKYMLGYDSAASAKKDFLAHMPEWAFGSMDVVDKESLDEMTKSAFVNIPDVMNPLSETYEEPMSLAIGGALGFGLGAPLGALSGGAVEGVRIGKKMVPAEGSGLISRILHARRNIPGRDAAGNMLKAVGRGSAVGGVLAGLTGTALGVHIARSLNRSRHARNDIVDIKHRLDAIEGFRNEED